MYIIGDVHGCYKTLCKLIEQLPNKYDEDIVFVGDLIDRGPDSKSIIELIIKHNYKTVLGNHEQGFLFEIDDIIQRILNNTFNPNDTEWYQNWGGEKTLDSYGFFYNKTGRKTLLEHIKWMKKLPLYLEYPNIIKNKTLVISHGYLGAIWKKRMYIKTVNQKKRFEEYILWNREVEQVDIDIFNIFGHTPVNEPLLTQHYANIDTGVYKKDDENLGKLTALHIPSFDIYQQELIDHI